ncbi:hypothetical protein ALO_02631 [Acetonema longum DSM 6540]|uniref:Uncharacterized protein n=1 Tax=Acetonema longum DSM 6540 TaxID=1009370 RepID=F7NER1_9FIRM|nr:hypothetical protein ALO_02631 [Acetonema longum DSM 6540]
MFLPRKKLSRQMDTGRLSETLAKNSGVIALDDKGIDTPVGSPVHVIREPQMSLATGF